MEIRFDCTCYLCYYCIAPERQHSLSEKHNSSLIGQTHLLYQIKLIPFGVVIGFPLLIVIFGIHDLKDNALFSQTLATSSKSVT